MDQAATKRKDPGGVFWGEMAPCDHLCQIYGSDETFLEALESFVSEGLQSDESVIVIATPRHLQYLRSRLELLGVEVDQAEATGCYVPLEAEEMLERFMVNGWPDDRSFRQTLTEVIECARGEGRKVRAFGEMVALLWARGHYAATIRLEHLWNKLLQSEQFPLFCAYPRSGFSRGASEAISEVRLAHSKLIST